MATLEELRAQYEALKAIRYSGVREVEEGPNRTAFVNDDDLKRKLTDLEREIDLKISGRRRTTTVAARYRRPY